MANAELSRALYATAVLCFNFCDGGGRTSAVLTMNLVVYRDVARFFHRDKYYTGVCTEYVFNHFQTAVPPPKLGSRSGDCPRGRCCVREDRCSFVN